MVGNRRIRFVIMLDSCCISIGLVFIKDRSVSSFWVLRFRDLGVFVFEFWVLCFRDLGVFIFEFWVLRFRDLGASCFGLRFRVLRFRNYRYFMLESAITAKVCDAPRKLHHGILFAPPLSGSQMRADVAVA